ncbi:inactive transglutaminase family protein [Spartinivicinus poritis]|uniref:Inactive transglutaminase family protein n=1 Tax=Spartinivicinus poritis TaxID=2994640 RepID=A0ABT5U6K7_9GAMM|nr:inactive transglutaminase family protein [Spartinivicinus sp. A2-2]MDE1461993.1 inactive transglutaminase family protein [Spartinivicinus sp. A2-2]
MSSRAQVYLLSFIFIFIGIGLTIYKNSELEFPLLPGERKAIWTVEAKIEFKATDKPVTVSFALPHNPPEMGILDEDFTASGYGFGWDSNQQERRAQWAKRKAKGKQVLFYKVQVFQQSGISQVEADIPPTETKVPDLSPSLKTTISQLVTYVYNRSADNTTFATELIRLINDKEPIEDVQLLLGNQGLSKTRLALNALALANVPARVARGLRLEDGRRNQKLTTLIEIFDTDHWVFLNPKTGQKGLPDNFILWQRGGSSLLDVEGGENSKVSFSIIKNSQPAKSFAILHGAENQAALVDFSIYSLPIEQQNVFKSILLVPIGAIVVVLMRILVGVKTSGTFMPILIAIAFIETTLFTGLIIFLVIVSIGLFIRSYLSRLNLLLVARISAVVIVVISIMAGMSILSHKLGISEAMSVTFFPMIILAWTIERMSILWEEEGPKEVFTQGGGSLLVATLAYLLMTNQYVEHLTFNFPELLLALLGCIILLGQYTGYRLTELRRFQPLAED